MKYALPRYKKYHRLDDTEQSTVCICESCHATPEFAELEHLELTGGVEDYWYQETIPGLNTDFYCGLCGGNLGFYFINVYSVCQEYGGPEEGGWWYKTGRALYGSPVYELTPVNPIEALANNEARNLYYQVFGVSTPVGWKNKLLIAGYEVHIECHPARDFPDQRPRYE